MGAGENTPALLNEITERIRLGYGPERIVLSGSHAYGKPDDDSDIDLFIIKEDPDKPRDRRLKVRRLLRDIVRRVPVSPIVYTPAELQTRLAKGDSFLKEIIGSGKVLYERRQ